MTRLTATHRPRRRLVRSDDRRTVVQATHEATEAREELARHSGSQFDPAVVRALFNVSLGRLHWSLGVAAWIAELPFLTVIPRAAAQVGALAAGPTASMSALSGVAAISLGSVVAPASMTATPVTTSVSAGGGATAPAPATADLPPASVAGTHPDQTLGSSPDAGTVPGITADAAVDHFRHVLIDVHDRVNSQRNTADPGASTVSPLIPPAPPRATAPPLIPPAPPRATAPPLIPPAPPRATARPFCHPRRRRHHLSLLRRQPCTPGNRALAAR